MNAQVLEFVFVRHRQDDRLDQLLDLLVQATDVRILLGGPFVHFHRLDASIVFGRQRFQYQIRVLVHADQIAGLQFLRVHQADDGQKVCLPCGRFDDRALAFALIVQHKDGSVVLFFLLCIAREQRKAKLLVNISLLMQITAINAAHVCIRGSYRHPIAQ